MKSTEIEMRTFLITNNDEIVGEGVEFTSRYCVVWWLVDRSPLEVYINLQALIDQDTKEKYIIQFEWER